MVRQSHCDLVPHGRDCDAPRMSSSPSLLHSLIATGWSSQETFGERQGNRQSQVPKQLPQNAELVNKAHGPPKLAATTRLVRPRARLCVAPKCKGARVPTSNTSPISVPINQHCPKELERCVLPSDSPLPFWKGSRKSSTL